MRVGNAGAAMPATPGSLRPKDADPLASPPATPAAGCFNAGVARMLTDWKES
ncbi:hypothetical protein [Sphingomonas metalli]|nr:hypothetical protein [Sphingomonas metalli]